jgi:phosphatidylglycerophosphate synthase
MAETLKKEEKYKGSTLLALSLREWWVYTINGKLINLFIRKKINPNYLTAFGFLMNLIAGFLFHQGYFLLAGAFIIFGGNFDFIDGIVARNTNQCTEKGAYFDSVIDRYADSILLIGLASFYRNSWIFYAVLFSLMGTFMVSYTKSRGEALQIKCDIGAMQRPERIFYLGLGSMLSSVLTISLMPFSNNPKNIPQYLLIFVIFVICVLSNLTAFQRIKHIMKELESRNAKNS